MLASISTGYALSMLVKGSFDSNFDGPNWVIEMMHHTVGTLLSLCNLKSF